MEMKHTKIRQNKIRLRNTKFNMLMDYGFSGKYSISL